MTISHALDTFFYSLFPELEGGTQDQIVNTLLKYYTYGPFKPNIIVQNNFVLIEIDSKAILTHETDYRKVVVLCEKGKFAEAKPLLKSLINNNPSVSEYHRIMGQILSEEGDQDEAINCLIDALRWDSKNGWALLMIGNIFAKHKKDVETAMNYYDQAVLANPDDYIAINNIGAQLLQQDRLEEAKKYFHEVLKINNSYPNAHFALGKIALNENDLHSAFYSTIKAIEYNPKHDVLYNMSAKQVFDIAKEIIASDTGKKTFLDYQHKLEYEGEIKIDIIQDEALTTAAKIEFAEVYNRDIHQVKYKPGYTAVEHLIMHEMVHLDFVIQARNKQLNQLFASTQEHKQAFKKANGQMIKKLTDLGLPAHSIEDYVNSLFDGLNLQIYNCPIDLFIEDYLYKSHVEFRPYQFLSLYNLIQQGLKAVTDSKIIEYVPKEIVSKSKIYNLVSAFQFKDLFGFDFIKEFKSNANELRMASAFYHEFLEYKDNKQSGEEYELIYHWAEDLKLENNFELIDEQEYRNKRLNIDTLLSSIENDPFDMETKDLSKQREMDKFQKSQEQIGTNMAVAMFMVEALQYFGSMSQAEIKKIALEIAMLGIQGFNPQKEGYRVASIPGKSFSGYHILAYYYVSWALAIPEQLAELQLPFDKEYEMALIMNKK